MPRTPATRPRWRSLATGAPEGYVNPQLLGEDLVIEEGALTPICAIPTQFGSLAPIPITVGAPNEAGTRFSTILETPADNSYIYDGMTCRHDRRRIVCADARKGSNAGP